MSIGEGDVGVDGAFMLLSFAVPSPSSFSSSERRRNVDSLGAIDAAREPGLRYHSSGTQNVYLADLNGEEPLINEDSIMTDSKSESLLSRVGSAIAQLNRVRKRRTVISHLIHHLAALQ